MAKIIKNKFLKISRFFLVGVIITAWIFSGFPQIFNFPPKIKKAQAAVSFIGSVQNNTDNGGDVTLTLSGLGLQQGDLVIVAYSIADEDNADMAMTDVGATWQEVADLFSDDTYDANLGVYYKVMGASPDASVVLDGVGGTDTDCSAVAMAFRGVDPTNPMDVTATTVSGASGLNTMHANPPAINHSNPSGVWTVIAGSNAIGIQGAQTFTFPTGYTTDAVQQGANDSVDGIVGLGYRNSGVSDPEDPGTMTASGTDGTGYAFAAVTMALRPLVQDSDSAVEVHGGGAQGNFNLDPLKDTAGEKFTALKFQISDKATADALPILIDQITIPISGTGGNASTDIAWAELYDDTGGAQVAVSSSITNSAIVFGLTPNGGGTAGLDTVASAGTIRYTVNVYMKAGALTATEGQTYIFGINDANIGADTGVSSSQMRSDASAVSSVTGTLTVTHSQLTFTTEPPATARPATDFTGTIGVSATDANGNVDTAFTENITLSAVLSSNNSTPGTGTLSSTDAGGLTKAATNGTATWTDTKYSYAEGIDIKAVSASTYTSGIFSSAVTVSYVAEILLVQQKDARNTYSSPNTPGWVTVTLDSAATAGNLLVTGISIDKASGTIAPPTDFIIIHKGEGGVSSGAMAYKIAVGGETSITWNWAASEEGTAWVGEYSGLASSNVLDVYTENETYLSTATQSISTGTTESTTQADELVVAMFMADSSNSAGSTRTWSNSFTTIFEEPVPEESGNPFLNVGTKTLTTAGTVETTMTTNEASPYDECYATVATFKAAAGEAPATATISSANSQVFTVNDSATAISTITITDTSIPTVTAANDIRIKIPATFNMVWDTSDTLANIAGTDWDHTGAASSGGTVTVTFEDSGKTVVIPVTADFESSDDITIYGLSFTSFTANSSADNLELELDNAGTTADTDDKTKTINYLSKSFQDGVYPDASYSGTKDTYVNGSSVNTNYGTTNLLELDGDVPDASTIIKWDISDIPTSSTVQSASIIVNITDVSTNTYEIYETKQNWVETEATWNIYSTGNSWATAGAQNTTSDRGSTILGTITASGLGSKTITLNSDGIAKVQDWISNPSTNYGIILQDYTGAIDGIQLTSREGATASQRPKLTIEYTTVVDAGFTAAIEIRAQDYTNLITSITFPQGAPGATISQPYNNYDGVGSPQSFGGSGVAKPVVALYNSGASTLTIWYNISTFTNGIVSNEYYLVNNKAAGCADSTVINNAVVFGTDTTTGATIAVGGGNEKDLYLKTILSSVAGKTGNSTLTILGEAL